MTPAHLWSDFLHVAESLTQDIKRPVIHVAKGERWESFGMSGCPFLSTDMVNELS